MSPPNAAATLAAVRVLKAEPARATTLQTRAKLFLDLAQEQGLDTGMSQDSPVIPIIVGDSLKSIQLSQNLFKRGINVPFMIYPSVPQNAARLRFFITCNHTEAQIRSTIEILADELNKL
jgi:7-keto-8-aminopelargonate synthetase-like enzyme